MLALRGRSTASSEIGMRFARFALLPGAITMVNAHFRLTFPPPRGAFNAANEVNFCDNYVHAVDNRSEFPLRGGFVTLTSGHPNWNLGILLSTVQDPTSFDNFTSSSGQQQVVRNFASSPAAGNYCIPFDLSNTGISGVADGANVTIQLVYNAGDGSLYQCSDLTLSTNFAIPSSVSCSNASSTTSASSSSTPTGKNGASGISTSGFTGALGFLIALLTA